MGYYLKTFIGKNEDIKIVASSYTSAVVVKLDGTLSMIPFTDVLFDDINQFSNSESVVGFELMNTHIENSILKLIGQNPFGYMEAEYFGGEGGQMGIIWEAGKRVREYQYCRDAINSILSYFNVKAVDDLDEFDTLGLGRYRDTHDWVEI